MFIKLTLLNFLIIVDFWIICFFNFMQKITTFHLLFKLKQLNKKKFNVKSQIKNPQKLLTKSKNGL